MQELTSNFLEAQWKRQAISDLEHKMTRHLLRSMVAAAAVQDLFGQGLKQPRGTAAAGPHTAAGDQDDLAGWLVQERGTDKVAEMQAEFAYRLHELHMLAEDAVRRKAAARPAGASSDKDEDFEELADLMRQLVHPRAEQGCGLACVV